ncbi:hypothetical protein BCU17_20040 [Vibrio splendidus]|uniref:Type I restriction modification DNA specificity domain-containing protein n=1 Tax=Vibrio splendidus TaxID=29497 RepID=A0A2N7FAY6_VIBSP|nr:hypothetical protein BCU17_20040 [Vibrio splendidus]
MRFGEFEGAWSSHRINDVSECVTSGSRDWAKYYSNKGDKFVRMTNLGREGINLLLEDMRYVSIPKGGSEGQRTSLQENDILISITAELGKIGIIPQGFGTAYINQHTALVRVNQQVNARFLAQNLATKKSNKKINRLNDSGAKSGLNLSTIRNYEFTAPTTLPEQQKIASFLSKVDEKIGLLSEKKDKLTEYKRGVMQQLFNGKWHEQDGQLTFMPPTLRFKADDGSEFPDWEEKKVSDIFEVTRGKVLAVPKMSEGQTNDYKYPVYSSQTKSNGLTGYYTEFLFSDAITWTTDGANAGDVKYREGEFYCTNVCGVLLSTKNANICMAELLNRVTHKYVSYVGNPKLMNGTMGDIKIPLPCVQEQAKIANFLSTIVQKIDLANSELDKAKEWKKGLLQQMFV